MPLLCATYASVSPWTIRDLTLRDYLLLLTYAIKPKGADQS